MIELTFHVACPHCGKPVSGSCEDFVVDQSADEREMGPEITYTIECDSYSCPHCEEDMALRGEIFEYPEGCENLNEVVAEEP